MSTRSMKSPIRKKKREPSATIKGRKPVSSTRQTTSKITYEKEKIMLNFIPINEYLDFSNLEKLRTHRGPLNFHAITMRNPNIIFDNLCKIIQKLNIKFTKTSLFGIKCEFGELRFSLEINSVEKFPNVFVIKFYRNNTTGDDYFNLCSEIFENLHL